VTVIDEIRDRLAALNPLSIEIEDDSALHAGHAGAKGGGGHYRMTMVSDAFIGKNTVARHRLIYGALGELMIVATLLGLALPLVAVAGVRLLRLRTA